jgi:prepilin peptidase CpaA
MHHAVLYVAVSLCVVIAYQDVRTRRIPNGLSLAMTALGLARIALTQDAAPGGATLAAGVVVFAVTLALFQYGIIGGGDAKLIPATALVIGYRDLLGFLFLMSLCGGVLAIAVIIFEKLPSPLKCLRELALSPSSLQIQRLQIPPKAPTVPYGFAVAVAGVMTLIASM